MPLSVTAAHVLTATTPDDPAYEIRPTHWNSAHAITASLALAATEVTGLFSNKNGISFGLDGTNITASYTVPAGGASPNFSAGTTSNNLGSVVFADSNGLAFGLSGSTITGSYTQSTHSHSTAPGAFAAGTQTATSGTIVFANSNNFTFGMSGSSQVTASFSQSTHSHSTSPAAIAAGTQTGTSGTIAFVDSNGLAFGMSGSTAITASYTQSTHSHSVAPGGIAAGTQTATSGTVVFANSNNFTFGMSGSSQITASFSESTHSHSVAPGGIAAGTQTATSGTVVFSNSNNVSFTMNGSSQVVASASFPAQTNQTLGYFASSNTTLTSSGTIDARSLSVRGIGGVSVGFSAGEILISGANGGGVTPVASASNGSFSFTTLAFSNANNVTFGTSAGGIITASVAAPGAAAENNWFALTGNTAGNTTASGSTIALSGGNNITLSGTNGSQIRIDAPNSSSLVAYNGLTLSTNGSTISIGEIQASFFRNGQGITTAGTAQANSLVSFQPFQLQRDVVFTNAMVAGSFNVGSAANASSAYLDVSVSGVVYSRNGSTLSSVASWSNSMTQSWNSNATGSVTGIIGITATCAQTTLTEGEYWLAVHLSTNNTATGGANTTALGNTVSMVLTGNIASAAQNAKVWGAQTNASLGLIGGLGVLSTNATRATVAFSDLVVTGTRALLAPIYFEVRNGTFQL